MNRANGGHKARDEGWSTVRERGRVVEGSDVSCGARARPLVCVRMYLWLVR